MSIRYETRAVALALVVFALTDERNNTGPAARLAPVFIGLTVGVLIAVIAPLTQACFNPARDLGPRLFAALAGVIVFLVLTITTQSMGAIAGLVACAFVAVIFRGALMGSAITTVDLKGSVMRIRRGGVLDIVNLADPVHLVELIGTPDQASWRLRLEAVDGRVVELGPQHVDPPEVHRIVEYYRAIAERDRRDRERRFNR